MIDKVKGVYNMHNEVKRLRVFEAFAGIGSQTTALKRLGIDYEIVGISDWFVDAIICYDALHTNISEIAIPTYEEQLKYLYQYEFSRDSMEPCKKLETLGQETIANLYKANMRSKNFGSITKLKGNKMPNTDLLVYSFPCQDLSTGGNAKGMKKGSGTRSCLLWEIERILLELKEIDKLPEYLLLENVTAILADSHIKDLKQWLDFLESIGYKNDECMILNALDFGIPQDRKRAFIVSHLNTKLNMENKINKIARTPNALDFIKNDYQDNSIYKIEADIAQLNRTPSREKMWEINGMDVNENTIVRTITCNMDRTHTAALFGHHGPKGNTYRRLTIREAFLLMGFTEEEYERTQYLEFSYRKMNKLIGNSIVVNVLIEIFRAMFDGKFGLPRE